MAKRTRKEAIRKELKKKEALASQKEAVKEEPVIAPEEELPEIETFEDIDDEIDTSQTVEYQKVEQKRKISFSERVKKLFMKENKVLHSLEQRADQILALEGTDA